MTVKKTSTQERSTFLDQQRSAAIAEAAEKQKQIDARMKAAAFGAIGVKVVFALLAPFISVWAISQFVPGVTLTWVTWLAALWFHYFLNARIEIDLSKIIK